MPALPGAPLAGDDAAGEGPATFDPSRTVSPLAGGARMVWLRDGDAGSARARRAGSAFASKTPAAPRSRIEPYMGMMGHAAFVRTDGSTFAHVHPTGSVPMAAVAALDGSPQRSARRPRHARRRRRPSVAFPYGLPRAGDYRIFVQVKRAGRIETGVFDARAH